MLELSRYILPMSRSRYILPMSRYILSMSRSNRSHDPEQVYTLNESWSCGSI